jgi:hypothetical protein
MLVIENVAGSPLSLCISRQHPLPMGVDVDIEKFHTCRQKKERKSVASTIVERKAIVVDKDEGFIWVLCGKGAASYVENYDIESAIATTGGACR